jgi:hypothetical protein
MGIVMLASQIVTGVWLAMHYQPSATEAFNSVEHIMRDVEHLARGLVGPVIEVAEHVHVDRDEEHRGPVGVFWTFGAILIVMLASQIVTGVWLAMHYQPSATEARGRSWGRRSWRVRSWAARSLAFLLSVGVRDQAVAPSPPGALVLHRVPGAAQPELLLDLRRHPDRDAGVADRHMCT